MRKILFGLFLLMGTMACMSLTSCSKDDEDEIMIQNLTGIDIYDAYVWFMDSEEAEEYNGFEKIGNLKAGESVVVKKKGLMCYLSGDNIRGKIFMTKKKFCSKNLTFSSYDVLISL